MSTQEAELALGHIIEIQKITWGEDRACNLGATVESLMTRRGFTSRDLDVSSVVEEFTREDVALAA